MTTEDQGDSVPAGVWVSEQIYSLLLPAAELMLSRIGFALAGVAMWLKHQPEH